MIVIYFFFIYNILLEIEPKLSIAMNLKYWDRFYEEETFETAGPALTKLIEQFQESDVEELMEYAKTLRRWKEGIINSFYIPQGMNQRVDNGIIENRSRIIKTLKRNSNRYKNWSRFRNRCLYVMNQDAAFHLDPFVENTQVHR